VTKEKPLMDINEARKVLVVWSLIITGFQLIFLLVAPAFGFPIQYPRNISLLQIVSPVFLGYLGSATHFIFINPTPAIKANNEFLGILIKGPLMIYSLVVVGTMTAFWYSNRAGAPAGSGISVENLATALSLALGLLAVTTGVISSHLFAAPREHSAAQPN
jgi:hypothetical protein